MKDMTKFLIAAGITAVGVAGTVYYYKKLQEKEAEQHKEEEDIDILEEPEKKDGFFKRIKKAATKKAVRILLFVVEHQKEFEAVGVVLSVCAGIFHIASAVKDYYTGEKLRTSIDDLIERDNDAINAWNTTRDIENERYEAIMKKLNDIHLDLPHDGVLPELNEGA